MALKEQLTWNKYQIKPELLAQNANLNHLVEPSFQGINKLFILAFEKRTKMIKEQVTKDTTFQM